MNYPALTKTQDLTTQELNNAIKSLSKITPTKASTESIKIFKQELTRRGF